jgi:hypothetical protein
MVVGALEALGRNHLSQTKATTREPIASCAFCGEAATNKASDGTLLCSPHSAMYVPRGRRQG